LPETDDNFPLQAHAAANEAELPVAMGRLVEVHEIHVNLRPGQVAVILCMQVDERFAQSAQTGNPHFCRGKGMHPGN
jgi:hypothetical protein